MRKMKWVSGVVALMMGLVPVSVVNAEEVGHESGPCGGASAPSRTVLAHVVGKQARATTKVIAHFESDSNGDVVGELIMGRGPFRLEVATWCRMWVGEKLSEHAGVVHVLGTATTVDGAKKLIQVDLLPSEGGRVRVRERKLSQHGPIGLDEEEHGGWVSLTGEGWLPVTHYRVSATQP